MYHNKNTLKKDTKIISSLIAGSLGEKNEKLVVSATGFYVEY